MRLDKYGVYRFFELPLALMAQDHAAVERIAMAYEWLNFEKTVIEYRRFFELLRP